MSVDQESCKESLAIVLNHDFLIRRDKEHYEDLLFHLCAAYDCRDAIYNDLFIKTLQYNLVHLDSLIKVAACFDERIIPKLSQVAPKLFTKLFAEDV